PRLHAGTEEWRDGGQGHRHPPGAARRQPGIGPRGPDGGTANRRVGGESAPGRRRRERDSMSAIHDPSDPETVPHRPSVARFFVENPHVSWVLLIGTIAWGVWAYAAMPKRKDPDIPVRQVAVITPWPGQSAERVGQLVTRKIEERVAQNIRVS